MMRCGPLVPGTGVPEPQRGGLVARERAPRHRSARLPYGRRKITGGPRSRPATKKAHGPMGLFVFDGVEALSH